MAIINKEPYITPEMICGLAYNEPTYYGATHVSGGWAKILGNLVIVNVRFTATIDGEVQVFTGQAADRVVSGNCISFNVVNMSEVEQSTTSMYCVLSITNGSIHLKNVVSGKSYAVNGVFLCNP